MVDNWFKSRKTPSLPIISSFDNGTSIFEVGENTEQDPKIRPTSTMRVLSFMKGTPSPVSSTFPSPLFDFEKYQNRAAECVWYEPNSDQIAETLKVTMMTRGNTEPVPVEYNSNILHVLELYWRQCAELKRKDKELEGLRKALNDQMGQIELLGKEWSVKEAQYKTELKNLEIMVANGVAGIEAVMLGRSNSVLDRTSSPIEARIRQIREGSGSSTTCQDSRSRINRLAGSGSAKEENEIVLSKAFSQKKRRRPEKHITDHFRPDKDFSEPKVVHPRLAQDEDYISREPEQQDEIVSDMSSSSDDEDITTTFETNSETNLSKSETKPLPEIPSASLNKLTDQETPPTKTHVSVASDSHNRHLSYVPGDDSFDWRRQRPRVVSRKSAVESLGQMNQDGHESVFSSDHPDAIGLSTFLPISKTSSGPLKSPNQSQLLARHLSQRGSEMIKRGDSNSSTVTAIRDTSERSSIELGSSCGNAAEQTAVTSNAAIAAVRAISADRVPNGDSHRS